MSPLRGPLTSTQRDVYLDQQRHPGLPIYSIGCSLPLGRSLDRALWEEAVRAVFAAEPILRTRVEETPAGLFQEAEGAPRFASGFEEGVPDDRDAVRDAIGRALRADAEGGAPFSHRLVRTVSGEYHSALGAPHLLSDGHTYRLFFERVAGRYEALAAGRPLPEEKGPTFYDYLAEAPPADAPEACAAWRERLRGAAPLHFRTRREAPGRYASESLSFEPAESAAIEAFCGANGVALSTFLLALHAVVLQRFREPNGDWILHAIRGTRPSRFAGAMGCFFRVVPYLLPEERLRRPALLADLFAYLRDYRRDPRLRADVSMLRLQESLPAGGSRVVFNFYDFDRVTALGSERCLEVYFSHPPNEAHLVVGAHDGRLELRHFFHTSHLRGDSVLARLKRVALQAASGARRVADLDWLLDGERPSRRSAEPAAPGRPVHALVEERAARRPDAVALVDGEKRLTYAELNADANRLARLLAREGVGPGTLVALRLDRSHRQVAAILAVWKAGGAYVPIDPEYPEARARFLLEDSRPALLVTDGDTGGLYDARRTLRLDFAAARLAREDASNPAPSAGPDDLAYVIYTSGSTGKPKGVAVTHHNVARLFAATRGIFGFSETDVWPLLHSFAFDFSVWEIWGALAFGGRLVVVPSCVLRSPEELRDLLAREGVTVLNQTPSAFYRLMDADAAAPLTALRTVVFGGEALDLRRLAPWFGRHGDERPALVNMYGITETTVHVTWRRIAAADAMPGAPSLIGRPLPDLHVHVTDTEGDLVPRGVAGEAWVAGEGVARGYLGRDELTAQRFLADPFDAGRVYRSGDLVREAPDGELEYLGRIDDQVQVRGYRVELGEVESVLRQAPGVADAAVLAHADADGEPLLAGYVVRKTEPGAAPVSEAELRDFLSARLPGWMLCARLLFLDAMPLTAHGKVDRAALPAPGTGRPELASGYVAPRTQTEELIAGLFAQATGVERVGIEDDFFALGGNSLSATQVVARLRQLLGLEVPLNALFFAPTVSALSEALAAGRLGGKKAPTAAAPASEPPGDAPLTLAQERVWLIQQLAPDAVAYHFEAALTFRGALRDDLLERALADLVARHEVYRTTFPSVAGRPVQRVHAEGVVALERVSLEHLSAEEARRHVERWRRETASRPFALDRLPLVTWTLFAISPREHVLLHREHHLCHDGWSFVVLLGDLLRAYAARLEGREPYLPPLPLRLGEAARAERRWMQGEEAEAQAAWWRERLAGAPASLELPADFARPSRSSYRGESFRVELPDDLVRALRALGRESGVTLFSTMLALFGALLAKTTGQRDLCVGSGVANRRPETEGILGMLLNNVVLRLDLTDDAPLADLLRRVQRTVFDAVSHGELPFDRVVRLVRPDSGPGSGAAVCPVFFSSYEGPIPRVPVPGLAVDVEAGLPNGSAKFDLNVIVVAQPQEGLTPAAGAATHERVSFIWEFRTDLFERATMERMARDYVSVLRAAVEAGGGSAWSALGAASERETLTIARGAATPYPRDASIPELWSEQAARRKDAVAVRDVHGAWTYGAVESVANQIAHLLVARGVAPGDAVGVCLPRGRMAVAAMLGVLKAGAAYAPVDPALPERRAAWLAADAGIRFVLTYSSSRPLFSGSPGVEALCVDRLERDLARLPSAEAPRTPAAGDLAYVMYTSGSTGAPKGVEVVHRGVVRLLFGQEYVRLGEETHVLQLAPLAFDAATFEFWAPLLQGGTVTVYPEEVPDAASLGRAIAGSGANTMWLNASLFNTIVDQDAAILAPLAQLLIGGEALSAAHVRRAYARLPRTRIINGYGPTENTTFSCCFPIPRDLPENAASVPLGPPIAHGSAYVLDERMRPLPWGAVGEIWLGGDGLARGYRGNPQLNAERFLPHPFDAGARLYRSGDFGRFRSDGALEFRGRRDEQVKIRGFRIEPAEIAWALERLPGVRRCAVVADTDAGRAARLVAYVVPEPHAGTDPERLRAGARLELPAHLVPQEFVFLDALPLTANGKLDRAALPAPPPLERAPAPARTACQEIVAGVMAEVLGIEEVGSDDHFFDLGGHSLLGIDLLARLARVLGVELPARALIENPTPAGLAALVEHARRDDPLRSLVRIKPGGGKEPLFFTPGGDGADGALLVYAKVARFLDPEQPFYGLRARRAPDGSTPHRSVEEMAADYLAEVRQVQPRGPYFFAGECVGGVIAYEMARQALEAGDDVRLLVLLDSRPPRPASAARHWLRYLSSRTRVRLDRSLGPLDASASSLRRWLDERLPYDAREAPTTLDLAWVAYQRTLLRYRPRSYGGRMALLLSEAYAPVSREWERLVTGGVAVHRAPGDHDSYIREHARTTAEILSACLEEARQRV